MNTLLVIYAPSCEWIYFAQILHYNRAPFIKRAKPDQFGSTSVKIKLPRPRVRLWSADCQTLWLFSKSGHVLQWGLVPNILQAILASRFCVLGVHFFCFCFLFRVNIHNLTHHWVPGYAGGHRIGLNLNLKSNQTHKSQYCSIGSESDFGKYLQVWRLVFLCICRKAEVCRELGLWGIRLVIPAVWVEYGL